MQKISVVIPTYNRAQYIAECIDSVIKQEGAGKVFTVEVVVVDDGSTDNTEEIVNKYIKRYDNIQYFRIKNSGGPAKPRNVGIGESSGGLVAFLDSDDAWQPSKLKEQLKAFEDPQVALCGTNAVVIDSSGMQTKARYLNADQGRSGNVFENLVDDNFIITSSVLVDKQVLEVVGPFNTKKAFIASEDYDVWLRVAAQHRIVYIDKTLVEYRQHDENISKADAIPAIKKLVIVLKSQLSNKLTNTQRINVYSAIAQRLRDISGMTTFLRGSLYKIEAKAYSMLASKEQG